jgi:hypothetical protein
MKILISYLALAILLVTFSYALNSQQKLNEQAQSVTSVNSKTNVPKNDKISQVSSNEIENSAASAKNLWKKFEAKGSLAGK